MELKNNKSAWAALATLGVTAVAAGATAIVKIREKRRERREELQREAQEDDGQLSAEQKMVYNEAIRCFLSLNDRIFDMRRQRDELQPLIKWLATNGEKPELTTENEDIKRLAVDIEKFLNTQVPFINACLSTVGDSDMTYPDYIRAAVGGTYDDTLDEEPTGAELSNGMPIEYVLRLGYYFPNSTIAPHPVKSIILA
jgi:hypothetical protein